MSQVAGTIRALEEALAGMVAPLRRAVAAAPAVGREMTNLSAPFAEGIKRGARISQKMDPERLLKMLLAASEVENATPLQKGAARLAGQMGLGKATLGRGGIASRMMGNVARAAIRSPKIAMADAVGIGVPAVVGFGRLEEGAIDGVSRMVTGDPLLSGPKTRDVLDLEQRIQKAQRARDIEEQARARRAVDNTVNLIRYAPEVANQVMAGRRLPKGAVMIGGRPRVDLMQQLAEQMSEGAFQDKDPLEGLGAIQ